MDIVSRLKAYIEHTALPFSQFADEAQIPRPTLSQILNGRNKKISNELFAKLHAAFPNLNLMWLMFGDGDMEITPTKPGETAETRMLKSPKKNASATINNYNSADSISLFGNEYSSADSNPADDPILETATSSFQQDEESQEKQAVNPLIAMKADSTKKIQNIMVFYSDSSFEIFVPSQRQ